MYTTPYNAKKKVSVILVAPRIFHPLSTTFIHYQPPSSTFIHFRPFSSTFIHFHPFNPLSSTFIHCRPLPSTFSDFHPLSSSFIHFYSLSPLSPNFIYFHPLSSTFIQGVCLDLFQITIDWFWMLKSKSGWMGLGWDGNLWMLVFQEHRFAVLIKNPDSMFAENIL